MTCYIGTVAMFVSLAAGLGCSAASSTTPTMDRVALAEARRLELLDDVERASAKCDVGDGHACLSGGLALLRGGAESDARRANRLLGRACALDVREGCRVLGSRLKQDEPERSDRLLARACALGDRKSCSSDQSDEIRLVSSEPDEPDEPEPADDADGGESGSNEGGGRVRPFDRGQPVLTGTGTCFAASQDGLIVTAMHVIQGAELIGVRFDNENVLAARVVKTSVSLDLALLRIERRTKHYLDVRADNAPSLGERVFTIGFPEPRLMGLEPKFEEGSVSAVTHAGDDAVLQTSVAVYAGNSGGALVRLDGSVAGVILSRWKDEAFFKETGAIASSTSFAVKSSFVAPFIGVEGRRRKLLTRERAIANAERAACLVLVGVGD